MPHTYSDTETRREYLTYLILKEWEHYLDDQTEGGINTKQNHLARAIAILSCLLVEKKSAFIRSMHLKRPTLEADYQKAISNQQHPQTHIKGMRAAQQQKVTNKEKALLKEVSTFNCITAWVIELFKAQPAYLFSCYTPDLADLLEHAKNTRFLKERFSKLQYQLGPPCVGTTCVALRLLTANFSGHCHEVAATFTHVFFNHISVLSHYGRQIDEKLQLANKQASSFIRLDEQGILEKEKVATFLLGLLYHLMQNDHPNPLAAGIAYTLIYLLATYLPKLLIKYCPIRTTDRHAYTNDEVNQLLSHPNNTGNKALCLTALPNYETPDGNCLIDNLVKFELSRYQLKEQGQQTHTKIIIPVISGSHWSLMYIDYPDHEGPPKSVYYFDSMGNTMPERLSHSLQETLEFPLQQPLLPETGRVQGEDAHCGTWIVHVAKHLMKHGVVPNNLIDLDIDAERSEQMKLVYPEGNPHTNPMHFIQFLIEALIFWIGFPYILNAILWFFPTPTVLVTPKTECNVSEALNLFGLSGNATQKEVKTAYRRQSLEHHPDRSPLPKEVAEAAFNQLVEARDCILNSLKPTTNKL